MQVRHQVDKPNTDRSAIYRDISSSALETRTFIALTRKNTVGNGVSHA